MTKPEPRQYMWYDPINDELIPLQWDLATIAFECAHGNPPPGIVKVETTMDHFQGRLFREDGAVLEYIGEI